MLYVNPLETGIANRILPTVEKGGKEKLALQELEHLFLFTLLQEMRKTIPIVEGSGNTHEKAMYDEMLDDALSGEMARSGQLGVAKQMEQQLRLAEAQQQIRVRSESQPKGAASGLNMGT